MKPSMKDRTVEFLSALESIKNQDVNHYSVQAMEKQHLISATSTPGPTVSTRTEFAKLAVGIGKEINHTMLKLQKLAALAKQKSLFDDKPVEINELIFVIKQDISRITKHISSLQGQLKGAPAGGTLSNRQVEEHSNNVITSLQSKLASTSNLFRDVLEVRTKNMKEQKERRDQYSFGEGNITSMSDSPLYNLERSSVVRQRNPSSSSDVVITGFGLDDEPANQQQQQQQMMQRNNTVNMEIIQSREQAIQSIESTIAELGQLYQHFALLLAGQRESIQRIGENVEDTEMNVVGAHTQLVKYFDNMSSNRWLMIKVLSVVVFFFMLFVLFLK